MEKGERGGRLFVLKGVPPFFSISASKHVKKRGKLSQSKVSSSSPAPPSLMEFLRRAGGREGGERTNMSNPPRRWCPRLRLRLHLTLELFKHPSFFPFFLSSPGLKKLLRCHDDPPEEDRAHRHAERDGLLNAVPAAVAAVFAGGAAVRRTVGGLAPVGVAAAMRGRSGRRRTRR